MTDIPPPDDVLEQHQDVIPEEQDDLPTSDPEVPEADALVPGLTGFPVRAVAWVVPGRYRSGRGIAAG